MKTAIEKNTADGCATDDRHKVCRSRGGESCAFDGAMIVLQPIADTAHVVHGPIACCGNSWEGRGTRSSKGTLHARGFTTDMTEMDVIYGSEEKLLRAIVRTVEEVRPRAVFVYSTCVSGLIGEDIDAVCRKAQERLGIRIVPVNVPGFVGPKNLGNRIAGEALLDHVIGTAEPPVATPRDVNLIGEYNIAGDLWQIEPLLTKAGFRVLARITGDATFDEITWAHRAKLNVVVCGRALVNIAQGMERRYGIPYVEVSFYGSTEIAKALRLMAEKLPAAAFEHGAHGRGGVEASVRKVIREEERKLREGLRPFGHLRGKRAVLYTGGVKSWSFISALKDLGMEIAAVGTKKSTYEDEQKMKEILGRDAPLVEDVSPANLSALLRERRADVLVAGGRNQYLAVKEGRPFVDVNQERHVPYAGYTGLVHLAQQISNSLAFYARGRGEEQAAAAPAVRTPKKKAEAALRPRDVAIDPLKHSPAIGAAMAFQGIHNAIPLIHGAQGCGFLGKVLLTRHFREPIALATTRLFAENVVMGSEDALGRTAGDLMRKSGPDVLGVLTSGLCEVKGDDVPAEVASLRKELSDRGGSCMVVHVATPDYLGGLETGYARAVEALVELAHVPSGRSGERPAQRHLNVFIGPFLTPGDVLELKDIMQAFGVRAVFLPDLSALDGSRQVFSSLAAGGTTNDAIRSMGEAQLSIVIGTSLEPAAQRLLQRCGVRYHLLEGVAGIEDGDRLMRLLSDISGRPVPDAYVRHRRILVDALRDAHSVTAGKKLCLALDPDHSVQLTRFFDEALLSTELAVIPQLTDAADRIRAKDVVIGDLSSVAGGFDLLISNSHAEGTARRLGIPLCQTGFPVFKMLGAPQKVTIGYRGSAALLHEVGNALMSVP